MTTYTKKYADMTFDRLRERAIQSLKTIIEDALLALRRIEGGGLPTQARSISQTAETIVETVAALEVLMEVRKLDAVEPKRVKLEDVVQIIKAEHLEQPQDDEDRAYDVAIDDAVKAVEGLAK